MAGLVNFASLICNSVGHSLPKETRSPVIFRRKYSTLLIYKSLMLPEISCLSEIPGELPQSLRYFDLSSNLFSGDIPRNFSDLSQLLLINLSYNRFSGEIPARNAIGGVIPAAIAALPKLQFPANLDLQHNQIHGRFPLILTNNSALTSLDVSWNLFSGKIPSVIGNLWRLEELRMANNSFEGALPFEITNCSNLKVIALQENKLSGNVPEGFSSLLGLCRVPLQRRCETSGNGENKLIMFIAVAASGALLLLSCCCFYTYNVLRWRRKLKEKAAGERSIVLQGASSRDQW
ncbi:hypothetical protein HAX54_028542 [Datura stramonium]|uniref:Uncharacterized protein n=1 Tax=Datura stramonium TaxID=4076 RepID=A0ABS8V760_DATST|nr:hypothetical protein [Datura stramonium]